MDKSASDPSSTADERLKPNELAIQKQPTCMISSKDGALYIEQVVLEQLKSIPGKIVVVAIAGVYRTGKSYLMNRLAGRSTGKDCLIHMIHLFYALSLVGIGQLYSIEKQGST